MSILHVFDMDGTLLRGTTASVEISRALGRLDILLELEKQFSAGEIDTHNFALQAFEIWKELKPDQLIDVIHQAPWIAGLEDVFTDIRSKGEWSLVVTMSPDFFANHLMSVGADTVVASRFPDLPFQGELDVAGILRPQDKVTIVEKALDRYAISQHKCIVYGDSASDIPLFQKMRNTVSVNGDSSIMQWSRIIYKGDDLREAYYLSRMKYI